ncbi:unnamed protein product [Choristocarpus tenellus]
MVVFFHNLWAAPLTAVGCTFLLIYVLGPSALVGVCTIPILIPLETWVARRSQAYRKSVLKVSDSRINLITEVIDGIKTIKLNSLGDMFQSHVERLRSKELGSIRKALNLNACNQAVMRSSPILVALATFSAYVLTGNELNAETAFTALALFNTVSHPFHVMPKAIQLLADSKVAIKRLENFLLEKETTRGNTCTPDCTLLRPLVKVENVDFALAPGKVCLGNVSAEISTGLSIIVGPVGSGKSTFLRGIIEHQIADRGEVIIQTLNDSVALCPDTPWIVNATARENICLGSTRTTFDLELYEHCIHACALELDFAEWPGGDEAIIGAKGITISGGQKARIALARALYSGCQVALLDDPLSALDTIVGRWVFDHAVCEMASKGVVIMSTHQEQYLEDADNIILIKDGSVKMGEDLHLLPDVGKGLTVFKATDASEDGGRDSKRKPLFSGTAAPPQNNSKEVISNTMRENCYSCLHQVQHKLSKEFMDQVNADRIKGGVSLSVYTAYMRACGAQAVVVTIIVSLLAQIVSVSKEYVLALWSDTSDGPSSAPVMTYLSAYSTVCLVVVMINCIRFFVMCWFGLRASTTLHQSLLLQVLGAPLRFFQVTESGRITSRFASDFDTIDMVIPTTVASFADALLTMLTAVGVLVGTTPAFLIFIGPIALSYYRVQLRYRITAKELKRLDSATKSPIYSHLEETLDGLSSVQAYRTTEKMTQKNFSLVDANMRARLCWDATNRWLGIRLDLLGALTVFLAALLAILVGNASPGIVGLGLSYALTITRTLSFGVRSSTAMENHFNSVERVQEFISLEQEQQEGDGVEEEVDDVWPSEKVDVKDLYARYCADLPPVLKGVSFSFRTGERVGICGRTGSGKSTLAMALIRGLDCYEGSVTMDGRNVNGVPLKLLRSRVTVISQDAHLFSGTVREIIDPMGKCSDAKIWDIVEMVGMKSLLGELSLGLDSPVSHRGSNWSAGQRQLLCIARAMVNEPRVMVFDEATANVDAQTDAMIQELIQSHLSNAAVMIIAHRLEDIIACHRVVVLDAGLIVEDGKPKQLLQKVDSALSQMVKELGPDLEKRIRTSVQ